MANLSVLTKDDRKMAGVGWACIIVQFIVQILIFLTVIKHDDKMTELKKKKKKKRANAQMIPFFHIYKTS